MPKTVIVAALKQEVLPLLRDSAFSWNANARVRASYGAWETSHAALICGGIGARAATAATEEAVRQWSPDRVISAGLAGALVPGFRIAEVLKPECVVSSSTGERYEVPGGKGVLVTSSEVAGEHGKRLLARHFDAQSADMEAAAVASVARKHGIDFVALKSVSDEYDFAMPDLNPFITPEGRFLTWRFALFISIRPRLWSAARELARNSKLASVQLCRELRNLILQNTATNDFGPSGRPRESQPAR